MVNLLPPRSGKRAVLYLILGALLVFCLVMLKIPRPCEKPLTYRIGFVDSRFGISRQDFAQSVARAADNWNRAALRQVFREDKNGDIEIVLIYDYRQEAWDKLKTLDIKIENSKEFYDRIILQYDNLKTEFLQKQTSLNDEIKTTSEKIVLFNELVHSANRQGGVPEEVYQRLSNQQKEMEVLKESCRKREANLKDVAQTLNSMSVIINQTAGNLNLHIAGYNDAGKALGKQYQQGFYLFNKGQQMIAIYQFSGRQQLIRALTHELGHALGLEHTDAPQSVMFRLMQSDDPTLTSEDIAALRALCKK